MTVMAEKPKKISPKKIAIVVHQEHSRPGRVGALLEKRGYELHRLCPNLGCELPEDLSDYAGVVIFGGPMSANDCGTLAGIKCELDWIPRVVEAAFPISASASAPSCSPGLQAAAWHRIPKVSSRSVM